VRHLELAPYGAHLCFLVRSLFSLIFLEAPLLLPFFHGSGQAALVNFFSHFEQTICNCSRLSVCWNVNGRLTIPNGNLTLLYDVLQAALL